MFSLLLGTEDFGKRELEPEARAFIWRTINTNASTVALNDRLRDVESDTQANVGTTLLLNARRPRTVA